MEKKIKYEEIPDKYHELLKKMEISHAIIENSIKMKKKSISKSGVYYINIPMNYVNDEVVDLSKLYNIYLIPVEKIKEMKTAKNQIGIKS